MTRLSIDQLGAPSALDVDATGVRLLGTWDSEASGGWQDVEYVAWLFLTADPSDDEQTALRWHHFLMAVGNFKRSTGPIVPAHLPRRPHHFVAPAKFDHPLLGGGRAKVDVNDPGTWRLLTMVHGLGVATATAVLSAIWPGRHVIVDERDSRATVALHCGSNFFGSPLDTANFPRTDSYAAYWDFYVWFLEVGLTAVESGCSPLQVERALYGLDTKVLEDLPADWGTTGSWSDYECKARMYLGVAPRD